MGFSFRKSIKIGGLRVNLSKSGIGLSAGIKGLRIVKNSKGKTYLNASKSGFTYRKSLDLDNSSVNNSKKEPTKISIKFLIFVIIIFILISFMQK